MASGGRDPVSIVESTIEERYVEDEFTRFWPGQFVTADLSERDVLHALRALVNRQQLHAEAFLHCPNDHIAWQGSPSSVTEQFAPRCRYCGESASGEYIQLQFTMTKGWRDRLDRIAALAQKKTSQRVNR